MQEVPWGAHLCQFFETKQDLLDSVVPFFKAGLDGNELCLWVVSEPLTEKEARTALHKAVPDFERHAAERRIEFHPHTDWYFNGKSLDLKRTARRWHEKIDEALARGHAGLRATGCMAWLGRKDRREFSEYERSIGAAIAHRRMIGLCTYPLAASSAHDILDVVRAHAIAVAVRQGRWEFLGAPGRRAGARSGRLAAAGTGRTRDTMRRTRAEAERAVLFDQVSASREELQVLSRRLLHIQETERRAIARELHDEIGQLLTGLDLMLATSPSLPPGRAMSRLTEAQSVVRGLTRRVQNLALDLRPAMLDQMGLMRSLKAFFERYTDRTKVSVRFDYAALDGRRFAPEVETTTYRIVQEALTNVARHAEVSEVSVRVRADSRTLSLIVEDRGRGFDPPVARSDTSSGLIGMRERAHLLGGLLTIDSAPGAGTRITAALPLGSGPGPRRRKGGAHRAPGRAIGAKAMPT